MTKHKGTRRAFLVRAAVGAGALAGARVMPEALAQNSQPPPKAEVAASAQHHVVAQGAFFNYEDAATIAAFTERLMPGAPGKPGALDAGVVNYIDLALAGAYADLQDFYRRGIAQLDAYCRKTHNQAFAQLEAARQDEVIAALEQGKAPSFTFPTAQAFFNTLRMHTMEGMFSDPIYGGNKDFAGWRLVGFPGAQGLFTPADMQNRQAFTRAPIMGIQGGLQAGTEAPVRKA